MGKAPLIAGLFILWRAYTERMYAPAMSVAVSSAPRVTNLRFITARVAGVLLACFLAFAPTHAHAQSRVPVEDARAMREVVQAQLDAFRQDDAARAFSLATPSIRKAFGTAEKFLEMVRVSYAAVYRPGSVFFEPPVSVDGEVVQPVRLTDSEGRAWIALYPMQRQPDGEWRTNGCQLMRLAGVAT